MNDSERAMQGAVMMTMEREGQGDINCMYVFMLADADNFADDEILEDYPQVKI